MYRYPSTLTKNSFISENDIEFRYMRRLFNRHEFSEEGDITAGSKKRRNHISFIYLVIASRAKSETKLFFSFSFSFRGDLFYLCVGGNCSCKEGIRKDVTTEEESKVNPYSPFQRFWFCKVYRILISFVTEVSTGNNRNHRTLDSLLFSFSRS